MESGKWEYWRGVRGMRIKGRRAVNGTRAKKETYLR